MYLCHIDESGTPELPGTSSHFVLAGISIPIWNWRTADRDLTAILSRYGLADRELHTAWLLRPYLEQSRIADFETLDWIARRSAVERARTAHLLHLQRSQNHKAYRQAKKNYRHTLAYIHLTYRERQLLVQAVADCVGRWGFARLFAECIDKVHFDTAKARRTIEGQALEQVVSRFDRYLENIRQEEARQNYGVLVHDNNQTVALKHTKLVRDFHREGTLWRDITSIIETPLFVDSSLTRMVQVADLCAFALRRYVESAQDDLFRRIFPRADRFGVGGHVVGVRHFSRLTCVCQICENHKPQIAPGSAPNAG